MYSRTEKKLLHYTGKAIADYQLIKTHDRVLVCLSGGKDSFALLNLLRILQLKTNNKFYLQALTVNQGAPGFCDKNICLWLEEKKIPYEILKTNIYSIVKQKELKGKSYCVLCSRLRRGHIYTYAKKHNFSKIALGHHRDDLIESLLMSIMYNGIISSMPPKLKSQDGQNIVVRPLVYCQEQDIINYAKEQNFPIVPCGLCGIKKDMSRSNTKELIATLAKKNPKIPSNILHSLSAVKVSQLMDRKLWDFKGLKLNDRGQENL